MKGGRRHDSRDKHGRVQGLGFYGSPADLVLLGLPEDGVGGPGQVRRACQGPHLAGHMLHPLCITGNQPITQ